MTFLSQQEITDQHNKKVVEEFINYLMKTGVINSKKHLIQYADKFIKETDKYEMSFIGNRWEF